MKKYSARPVEGFKERFRSAPKGIILITNDIFLDEFAIIKEM